MRGQIAGQMSIFDYETSEKQNKKNAGLGGQCETCDVEWCSIICFQRRGYIWDRAYRFAKDENGNKIRRAYQQRECKRLFGCEEMP